MYKLGIIGVGHMGGAILRGAVDCNVLEKQDVLLFDLSSDRKSEYIKDGYSFATGYKQLRDECEYLLLAVAPQIFQELMVELAIHKPAHRQLIVSVAAGIDSQYIKKYLGQDTGVICVMPNAPLLIGIGATAMAKSDDVTSREFSPIKDIFAGLGVVAEMPQEQLFAIVPAGGSTPAYVYYFIDSIAKAVAARGVDYDTALLLTAQSFKGSAELLLRSEKTAQQLIDGICTPGGLTAQTIEHFNNVNLPKIIKEGCDACIDRGLEIRGQKQ